MDENKRSETNSPEDADIVLSENNSAGSEKATGSVSAKDLLGKLKKNMSGSKKKNKKEACKLPEREIPGSSDKSNEFDIQSVTDGEIEGLFAGKLFDHTSAEADREAGEEEFLSSETELSDETSDVEMTAGISVENDQPSDKAEFTEDIINTDSVSSGDAVEFSDSEVVSDLADVVSDDGNFDADSALTDDSEYISDTDDTGVSQESSVFDDFDSDDGVDDTDVQLMMAFGMEDELAKTVGFEKAAELSGNADETGRIFIPKRRKHKSEADTDEQTEFTSPDQIKPILSGYKLRYRTMLVRMLCCAVLLVLSFLFENLEAFGAKIPNWMDSSTYPVVYTMLGFQFVVLGGALVWEKLRDGFSEIVHFKMTSNSAMAVMIAFTAVYDLIMCFMHLHSAPQGIRFFGFPVIVMVMSSLVGEYMDLRREIFCFNVVASKKHKYVIESLSEEQASLEINAFADFMPPDASIFRIGETDFVDGFYSRMRTSVSGQRAMNALVPVTLAAAVIFFVWNLIIGKNADLSFRVAQYTMNMAMPAICMLVLSYPFFKASKMAYRTGSAIIGGKSLEEYSTSSSAITFEDKDVFPASGVMVKSIKTYGDSRIDYIIYNVASLFMAVGGPLAEVFESATKDLEHTEDVELTDVVQGGLEAYVSGEHVYCGTADYFVLNGLDVPYDPEDDALRGEGSVSIMLLAIGGKVVAKLYIQYMLDRDFEITLKQLSKLGICVGIKTFDPNITDVMLNSKVRLAEYPIKILRCRTAEDVAVSSAHTESGVVSRKSVKSMMYAYSLCEKVLHAMKTGVMLKVLSSAFALVIVALLLLFGVGESVYSWQVALYQLIWVVPTVFITKLYVSKN